MSSARHERTQHFLALALAACAACRHDAYSPRFWACAFIWYHPRPQRARIYDDHLDTSFHILLL
eukprot:scaffold61775_cov31-Tisochrysis_lutea.AAC.2